MRDLEVIGTCEACGKQILVGEIYHHDDDGVRWHKECPDDKEDRAFEALFVCVMRGINPTTLEPLSPPPLTDEDRNNLKSMQPGFMANLYREFKAGRRATPRDAEVPDA